MKINLSPISFAARLALSISCGYGAFMTASFAVDEFGFIAWPIAAGLGYSSFCLAKDAMRSISDEKK